VSQALKMWMWQWNVRSRQPSERHGAGRETKDTKVLPLLKSSDRRTENYCFWTLSQTHMLKSSRPTKTQNTNTSFSRVHLVKLHIFTCAGEGAALNYRPAPAELVVSERQRSKFAHSPFASHICKPPSKNGIEGCTQKFKICLHIT